MERFPVRLIQRLQQRFDRRQASVEQRIAGFAACVGQMQGVRTPIGRLATFDQTIRNEAIHQSHGTGMREVQNAPQLIVGRSEPIADDHERGGGLTGPTENLAADGFDTIRHRQPESTEKIGCPSSHGEPISAGRTFFN